MWTIILQGTTGWESNPVSIKHFTLWSPLLQANCLRYELFSRDISVKCKAETNMCPANMVCQMWGIAIGCIFSTEPIGVEASSTSSSSSSTPRTHVYQPSVISDQWNHSGRVWTVISRAIALEGSDIRVFMSAWPQGYRTRPGLNLYAMLYLANWWTQIILNGKTGIWTCIRFVELVQLSTSLKRGSFWANNVMRICLMQLIDGECHQQESHLTLSEPNNNDEWCCVG